MMMQLIQIVKEFIMALEVSVTLEDLGVQGLDLEDLAVQGSASVDLGDQASALEVLVDHLALVSDCHSWVG